MYRLKPEDFVRKRFIGLWSLLAFQAGFINSIGFLAFSRFVSHVTGFGSSVGINIAKGEYWIAIESLSAPAAFILGAWFNGCLTVARAQRGLQPRYDLVTLLIPTVLISLLFAGENGFFGFFGEPLLLPRDFIFLSLLSFVCGLQNACFATLTKGQIRTTHLTGISTDIGSDLALITHGKLEPQALQLAKKRNLMRYMTFFSFSLGAVISATVDARLEFKSLIVPVMTSSAVAFIFFKIKFEIDAAFPQPRPS